MGSSPRSSGQRRNAGWWAPAIVAPPTIALSLLARGDGTLPGDLRIARFVQRTPDAIAGPVSRIGNLIGSSPFLFGCLLAIGGALFFFGRRHDALAFALCILAHLINQPLKALVDSPRPAALQVRVAEHARGLGFPSGHAMAAIQLCGAIALVLDPFLPPGTVRTGARAILIAIPLLVGFSRVYVGAHWPSDVLGGFLWGLLTVLLVRSARQRWPAHLSDASTETA
jgi:membrane-associated phospholipid phosphatase